MQKVKKVALILSLSILLLGAPMLARVMTNIGEYNTLDPDKAFVWISIRHTIQALIIALVMVILSKTKRIDFHIGLGDKMRGIAYLKKFMVIFFAYTVIVFVITIITSSFSPFQFPLNARNILGYMGFQLLLSGPSEELIFRAFAITMFTLLISHKRLFKHLSYANLFAAIIFALAHIVISFSPFGLRYSLPQLGLAFGLGLIYGDCYEKTKSIIYPMIMHSFTNVIMVGLTIFITFLMP